MNNRARNGFTLVEIVIVAAIAIVITSVSVLSLTGVREEREVSAAAKQVAAVLREASSRSANQQDNAQWGVRFVTAAGATDPNYYELFRGGTYDASNVVGRYTLPNTVGFEPTAVPVDVVFEPITGTVKNLAADATTSMKLKAKADPKIKSNITVFPRGNIKYQLYSCFITCSEYEETIEPPVPGPPPPPRLTVLRPNSDAQKQWTKLWESTNYLEVDEATLDGAQTYVKATAASKIDRYNFETFVIPQGEVITSVAIHFLGHTTGGSIATLALGVYVNGKSYTSNKSVAICQGACTISNYQDRSVSFSVNPETNAPWTQADIDNLMSYMKVNSISGGGEVRISHVYAEVVTQGQ